MSSIFDEDLDLFGDASFKDYYKKRKEQPQKPKILTLLEVLGKMGTEDKENRYREEEPFWKKLIIPVGEYENGEVFKFEISSDEAKSCAMIVGGTRSGKSNLLHSIILSACSRYTPDEVQFYIADFKEYSNEFSSYIKNEGQRNLFMPHVRFVSCDTSRQNALSILDKINELMEERYIAMHPYVSFEEYNKEQEKLGEDGKKMPWLLLLIDEADIMLGSVWGCGDDEIRESARMNNQIRMKMGVLMRLARSVGIGIILTGQDVCNTSELLNFMDTRLCLKVDNNQIIRELFNVEYSEMRTVMEKLERWNGLYTGEGGRGTHKFVTLAHSEATSYRGESAMLIAGGVRDKYSFDAKYSELYENQVVVEGQSD